MHSARLLSQKSCGDRPDRQRRAECLETQCAIAKWPICYAKVWSKLCSRYETLLAGVSLFGHGSILWVSDENCAPAVAAAAGRPAPATPGS
jgi:hypothetical protein